MPLNHEADTAQPTQRTIIIYTNSAKFPMGRLGITPAAVAALEHAQVGPASLLTRHVHGDYGAISREDWAANETAIIAGARIVSSYPLVATEKLAVTPARHWLQCPRVLVITEADRSATTILCGQDY